MQRLPLDGVSSDDGAFGADGVAQAGHELHVPLAEPGVCGLALRIRQKPLSATVRTGVFVEGRGRIRGPEALGTARESLGPRSALAGSVQSRVWPGKGPDGGLWGHYLRQRADRSDMKA